jgi:hypothetical protein
MGHIYDNTRYYAYFADQLDNFSYTAAQFDDMQYTARYFDLALGYSPDGTQAVDTPGGIIPQGRLVPQAPSPGVELTIFRSTNGNGYQLEYDGSPVAIGNSGHLPFDTAYISNDGTTTTPFNSSSDISNDYIRFHNAGGQSLIQVKKYGIWRVQVIIQLSAPLTHDAKVILPTLGSLKDSVFPAGYTEFDAEFLAVISNTNQPTASDIVIEIDFDVADQTLNYIYNWIALVPIAMEA